MRKLIVVLLFIVPSNVLAAECSFPGAIAHQWGHVADTDSEKITVWRHATEPQPSAAEIEAVRAGACALEKVRREKKAVVKSQGLALMQAQIPGINSFETAEMFKEFVLSVAPAARDLTVKVQAVSDYWTAGAASIAEINALTTEQQINDYVIVWP